MKPDSTSNDQFEKLLQEAKPALKEMLRAEKAITPEVLDKLYAQLNAEKPFAHLLSTPEMQELILRVLAVKQHMDGVELCQRLREKKVRIKGKGQGDAAVYGVLRRLESTGLVVSEKREIKREMVTVYSLTGKGRTKAQKHIAEQNEVALLVPAILNATT